MKNFGLKEVFQILPIDYSYEEKTLNELKNGGSRCSFRIKVVEAQIGSNFEMSLLP